MSVGTPNGKSDARLTLFDVSGRTAVRVAYQPSVVLEYEVQHLKEWKLNMRGKQKENRSRCGLSTQALVGHGSHGVRLFSIGRWWACTQQREVWLAVSEGFGVMTDTRCSPSWSVPGQQEWSGWSTTVGLICLFVLMSYRQSKIRLFFLLYGIPRAQTYGGG